MPKCKREKNPAYNQSKKSACWERYKLYLTSYQLHGYVNLNAFCANLIDSHSYGAAHPAVSCIFLASCHSSSCHTLPLVSSCLARSATVFTRILRSLHSSIPPHPSIIVISLSQTTYPHWLAPEADVQPAHHELHRRVFSGPIGASVSELSV